MRRLNLYLRKVGTKALLASALLLSGAPVYGVQAKPGAFDYRGSDGTTINVTLHGDEWSSYYLSSDGYILLPDTKGDLYYAINDDGVLKMSSVRAYNPAQRSAAEKSFITNLDRTELRSVAMKTFARHQSERRKAHSRYASGSNSMITSYPTIGSPNSLILLVQFSDITFTTPNPQESFNNLINQEGYSNNGGTGSALDYFRDNSSGLFTPNFEVYGPVTVPQSEIYYGASTATAYDTKPWEMVKDAIEALHEQHPELDFSKYDNDGDGFVDSVFIFFAGYGQNEGAESWRIWPHAANLYTLYNIKLEYNGVKIGNYACTNELRGTSGNSMNGIGTFVHEFSHILGLPDLYDIDYSGAFTPGYYEVMDSGNYNNDMNTPPHYSVFDLYSVGWLNPRELSGTEQVVLNDITSNEGLKINSLKDTEYYLFENRQQTGWDKYIPGHGMLAWHIDYVESAWTDNTVNSDSKHMYVDLVEADNIASSDSRDGDPFPGTAEVTSFTATSKPAMATWYGVPIDMPLTDIHENADGQITFKVRYEGGVTVEPVTATDPSDILPTAFTANWQGRPEIYTYEVDLYRGIEPVPLQTVTVENAYSYTFSDLKPSTEYSYIVRAVDSDVKSVNSNRVTVVTADPTFDMYTTVALPATNVYSDMFTANWQELEGAAGYILNVYEKDVVDPKSVTVDFTKDDNGDIIPSDWYTNCTSTASVSGYYGDAKPSLRMIYTGDQLATPTYTDDDINSFKFWYRGNNTSDDNTLTVEALIDGSWSKLLTISPLVKTAGGATVSIGNEGDMLMPDNVKQIRILYSRTDNASVYIDDVVMEYGGIYTPIYLSGYEQARVAAAPSAKVLGVKATTPYYYNVCGYDANGTLAQRSGEIKVTTTDKSSVEHLRDAEISVGTRGATITIANGAEDAYAYIYTSTGLLLWKGELAAYQTREISALQHGVYFVMINGLTRRVAL